jgi:hypothetical protein
MRARIRSFCLAKPLQADPRFTKHELQARTDVRLMFTSRFIPEITQKFCSKPTLEVRASEEDVMRFVAGQMPRLPNRIRRDDELKRAVQDKIVEAVDGM